MLLSVGIVMVYSTSTLVALEDPATSNAFFFIKKQLIWAFLACIGLIFCMDTDYHIFSKYGFLFYLSNFIFNCTCLVPEELE